MHAEQRRDCRNLAAVFVAHFVLEADLARVQFQDPRADRHHVTRQQFAPVFDVLIDRRHAALMLAQVGGSQADLLKQIPCGLVEFPYVPHDVHVADMVAVPWVDGTAVGDRAGRILRAMLTCCADTARRPRTARS